VPEVWVSPRTRKPSDAVQAAELEGHVDQVIKAL